MYQTHSYFIFDLDGTLAYTIEDLRSAMNRMLAFFGFPKISTEEALKNINFGARAFVRGSLPEKMRENEEWIDRAYEKYSEFYAEEYSKTTTLYPYVSEGIQYLKDHGAKLAVFSNKQDTQTKAICEKLFPTGTFEIVLGHNGQFPHKPSPEGALYIAGLLGGKPEETVLVGDSDVDMKLAANAGMHPVGVAWGYRPKELLLRLGAEKILNSVEDFKALISPI